MTGSRRAPAVRAAHAAALVLALAAMGSCGTVPDDTARGTGVTVLTPGVTVLTPYPGDRLMWDHLLDLPGSFQFRPDTAGVVLPHHLSDDAEISAAWRGLAEARQPELIVLLCTDHFLAGPLDITLPDAARFETVYGELAVERRLAGRLARLDPASRSVSDGPFPSEHGISVHATFLRARFPRTRVLPLLVKAGTGRQALDALARDLAALVPDDTLFVGSVDFSHYNMVAVSRFHDRMTASAIVSMDAERLPGAEVDSPEVLSLMTALMAGRGASRAEVFHRTDLQDRFPYPIADNTSHLYVHYLPGPAVPSPAVTLLVLPALPAGTEAAAPAEPLRAWTWDWRDPDRTSRLFPTIARLAGAGEEDRFFMGSDLYLFGLPPGRIYRWKIGGTRVSLVTIGGEAGDLPAGTAGIAAERPWAELLVAVVDCAGAGNGPEALEAAGSALARAGADLVVLRAPAAAGCGHRREGTASIVVLPGWLVLPDGGAAAGESFALAAVWTPAGLELEALRLGHESGRPFLADLPFAKSYHPPAPAEGRE